MKSHQQLKVRNSGEDEVQELEPTQLPKVSLSGTLKVASLDTYYQTDDEPPVSKESTQTTTQLRNPEGVMGMRRLSPVETKETAQEVDGEQVSNISSKRNNKHIKGFLDRISEKSEELERRKRLMKKVRHGDAKDSKKSVRSRESRVNAQSSIPAPQKSTPSFMFVHVSIVLSAAVIIFLLGLDSRVVSDNQSSRTSLEFNFANVIDLLRF